MLCVTKSKVASGVTCFALKNAFLNLPVTVHPCFTKNRCQFWILHSIQMKNVIIPQNDRVLRKTQIQQTLRNQNERSQQCAFLTIICTEIEEIKKKMSNSLLVKS